MARIVMKFGGTSMAGTERIRRVANIVRKQQAAGHEVAVVVSAMAGETDRLVNFCREANALYNPAEYDVVVASGEQVTSGLLALTLQAMGCKARSWLGWQLPVHTVEAHAKARIDAIDSEALTASMAVGEIAVIPGFQGLGGDGLVPVSTLGSDYYRYDEASQTLRGDDTGETFASGQRLRLRLVEAEPISGALRFALPDAETAPQRRGTRRDGRRNRGDGEKPRRIQGRRGRPGNIRHR